MLISWNATTSQPLARPGGQLTQSALTAGDGRPLYTVGALPADPAALAHVGALPHLMVSAVQHEGAHYALPLRYQPTTSGVMFAYAKVAQ